MTKKLPKLYARGKNGKTLTWLIEVVGQKYRTITGAVEDKKVVSSWTQAEAKNVGRANETTPEEQAIAEATSKWQAKVDKEHYFEDESDIDKTNFVQCMLAEKLKDRLKEIDWKKGVIVQIKFNGHRCIATKDGLFTRKGKKYVAVPHIEESLQVFFQNHPDAVLDGELFNYGLRQKLNEISKICRKTVNATPDVLKKSKELVRYCVYDGWGFDGLKQEDSYTTRKKWIDGNLGKYSRYYDKVEDYMVYSFEELNELYDKFLDDHQEGAIIRIPDSGYECKRSKNLLKYKPQYSDEAFIVSLHEGTGNWAGAAKTATLNWNGIIFDATFKGEYSDLVEILKNQKKWIAEKITFLHLGLSGLGVPTSARIDPYNCFEGDK